MAHLIHHGPWMTGGGSAPSFSGHIWVSNFNDSTVQKFYAPTGSLNFTTPMSGRPTSMASHGNYVYVANYDLGGLTKIRASDGLVIGNYPATTFLNTTAVIHDGVSSLWCIDGQYLCKYNLATDSYDLTFPGYVGAGPSLFALNCLASDGVYIWGVIPGFPTVLVRRRISDGGAFLSGAPVPKHGMMIYHAGNLIMHRLDGTIEKFSALTGASIASFGAGGDGRSLATDGSYVWYSYPTNGNIARVPLSFTSSVHPIEYFSVGGSTGVMTFDGSHIWCTDGKPVGHLNKVLPLTGSPLGSFNAGDTPFGITTTPFGA